MTESESASIPNIDPGLIAELVETVTQLEVLASQRGKYVRVAIGIESILDDIIADYFGIAAEKRDACRSVLALG